MATPSAQDKQCSLRDIPPELRLRIYDHVISNRRIGFFSDGVNLQCYSYKQDIRGGRCPGYSPVTALLCTVSWIYQEASSLVYDKVTFVFDQFLYRDRPDLALSDYMYWPLSKSAVSAILQHARRIEIALLVRQGKTWKGRAQTLALLIDQLGYCNRIRYLTSTIDNRYWPTSDADVKLIMSALTTIKTEANVTCGIMKKHKGSWQRLYPALLAALNAKDTSDTQVTFQDLAVGLKFPRNKHCQNARLREKSMFRLRMTRLPL